MAIGRIKARKIKLRYLYIQWKVIEAMLRKDYEDFEWYKMVYEIMDDRNNISSEDLASIGIQKDIHKLIKKFSKNT